MDDAKELMAELLGGTAHEMAKMQSINALGHYFSVLDGIGEANQQFLEANGEPAVHVTTLMIEGAMGMLVNIFTRVDEGDRDEVFKELQNCLAEAPTIAAKALAETEGHNAANS